MIHDPQLTTRTWCYLVTIYSYLILLLVVGRLVVQFLETSRTSSRRSYQVADVSTAVQLPDISRCTDWRQTFFDLRLRLSRASNRRMLPHALNEDTMLRTIWHAACSRELTYHACWCVYVLLLARDDLWDILNAALQSLPIKKVALTAGTAH